MPNRRTDNRLDWPLRLVLGWGANLLALWLASRLIDSVNFDDFGRLAIAAAVLSIVNLMIKPLLTLVSCVLIILTLGLALFLVNMACVALTAWLVPGFGVGGFWSVAGTTAIVWLVNLLVQALLKRGREEIQRR
jgi:putative membrane protein